MFVITGVLYTRVLFHTIYHYWAEEYNIFGKILRNSQNIHAYYMLNHRIRCILYILFDGLTYNTHGYFASCVVFF